MTTINASSVELTRKTLDASSAHTDEVVEVSLFKNPVFVVSEWFYAHTTPASRTFFACLVILIAVLAVAIAANNTISIGMDYAELKSAYISEDTISTMTTHSDGTITYETTQVGGDN